MASKTVARTCRVCGKGFSVLAAQVRIGRGKCCSYKCSTELASQTRWKSYWKRFEEEFWSRVDKTAGSEACWPYTGTARPDGYGRFRLRGKYQAAHRIAFRYANGKIQGNLFVCHKCDNPICCNPKHLFLGTHQDNMDDMTAKGRRRGAPRKINRDVLIKEINAGKSKAEIARSMDVSPTSVTRALRAIEEAS